MSFPKSLAKINIQEQPCYKCGDTAKGIGFFSDGKNWYHIIDCTKCGRYNNKVTENVQ